MLYLRCDQTAHTNGFFDRKYPVGRHGGGNRLSIGSRCLLAEPFEEIGGVRHLSSCIGDRLAIFPSDQCCKVFSILHHEIVPFSKQFGLLTTCLGLEIRQRCLCGVDGGLYILDITFGGGSNHLVCGRICSLIVSKLCARKNKRIVRSIFRCILTSHFKSLARPRANPLTVDIYNIFLEKGGVFELYAGAPPELLSAKPRIGGQAQQCNSGKCAGSPLTFGTILEANLTKL